MGNTPAISSGALSHSRSVRSVAMPVLCLRARQSEAASTPLKTTFVKRPAASQEGRTGQSGQRIKSPRCLAVVPDVNRTLSVALGAHIGRAPPASLACRARAGAFGGAVGDRHLGGRHEDGASAAPWRAGRVPREALKCCEFAARASEMDRKYPGLGNIAS